MVDKLAALTSAIPQLAQLPQCALPAYGAIAAAGCGPKLACICGNDNFFLALQGTILQGSCSTSEAIESLHTTRDICTEAVPWLNDNRGPEVVAAVTVLTILATIAVIMRCLARRVANLRYGWDDWLIFLALTFAYGLTITQYFAVHYGLGRHMLMLNLDQITTFTKTFFATTIIFPVSAAAIKLSVLFFYVRIFPMHRFRVISIIIGLVVIAWFIAFIFLQFFTCIPLNYFWDKSIPGHCINQNDVAYYGTSPGDIATNVAILVLPIPYLWNLQMRRAKKLAITGIFILGSFAAVGSVVRVPLLVQLKPTDVSYTVVNAGIWLSVECNIGILSASLPVLRPLFSKHFPSSFRSRLTRSRPSRYGTGSQRLPDAEKGNRSSTLGNSGGSAGVYSGGTSKGHKTWYDNAVTAIASKNDETGSDCSREEMVPMGRIAVRHDFGLDTGDKDSEHHVTPPAAA